MSDIAQIWTRQMEDSVRGIERLIAAAAERAADLERDPLLNGRRQSVAALKNHLRKLAEDAIALRKDFRPLSPGVEESVDRELADELSAARDGTAVTADAG